MQNTVSLAACHGLLLLVALVWLSITVTLSCKVKVSGGDPEGFGSVRWWVGNKHSMSLGKGCRASGEVPVSIKAHSHFLVHIFGSPIDSFQLTAPN